MKHLLLLVTLLVNLVQAQPKLPVIRATSKSVSIRDGEFFDKNTWSLSPQIRPDVYTADRTRKTKWVTFYTDVDSIRVKVKPGTRFNFVILLNGADSCYTQIASAIPPKSNSPARTDTIPFALTAYNTISIKTVVNDTTTIAMHFDASAFGLRLTRDALAKYKIAKVNKLQMGTLTWHKPLVGATNVAAHDMDGRLGWDVFEDRVVEINYDSNLLIIYPQLPKGLKGYVKIKLNYKRSFPNIQGSFMLSNKIQQGSFLLDNGSEQALIVDSTWAARNDFAKGLKLIRTSVLKDPRGVEYVSRLVLSPQFNLNGFTLTNVPTLILPGKNPTGMEVNVLGNDVLKRFNILMDFQHDWLYMRPNGLMSLKYKEAS